MDKEYTYDEVFRSLKKIIGYLDEGRFLLDITSVATPAMLLRDFLLLYTFLKAFNIEDLHSIVCKKQKEEVDSFQGFMNKLYKEIYVQYESMSIKYLEYNGAIKYTNYQGNYETNYYFLSCSSSEMESLKKNSQYMLIDDDYEFEIFMDKLIAKSKHYKKSYKEVYVQNNIIKKYFENHGWSVKQNDFRSYYYTKENYRCISKIPKKHTTSAMLKKIIIYGYKNTLLNSMLRDILNYQIYSNNTHIDIVDINMQILFRFSNNAHTKNIETVPNKSIHVFVNNFMKVLSWDIDEVINMFNRIQNNQNDIPSEFSRLVVEPIINYQYENNARSFFFSGVGANNILVNSFVSLQKSFYLKNKDIYSSVDDKKQFPFNEHNIDLSVDDKDKISLLNRLLIYQIKNQDEEIADVEEVDIFNDTKLDEYDIVFTIAPTLLKSNENKLLIGDGLEDVAYNGVSGHQCRFSSDSLRRDIFSTSILA